MIDKNDTRSFLDDYMHALKRVVSFFATRIRQNLFSFLLIIVLATAAGAAYWYTRTPYYESELVCIANNDRFERKTYGEMVQKLNLLATSSSRNELARILKLSPGQTSAIIAVEAKNRAGSPLYEDITGDYQPMYITLKATDNRVFAPFQDALVNYMSQSPYLNDYGAVQIASINHRISLIEGDIRKVDSIIDAYTVAIRAGLVFRDTVTNKSDVTDILNHKSQLEDNITHFERRKVHESGKSVTVMHGYAPPDKPSKGSKKVIIGFAMIGVLVALGWVVLRDSKHVAHA